MPSRQATRITTLSVLCTESQVRTIEKAKIKNRVSIARVHLPLSVQLLLIGLRGVDQLSCLRRYACCRHHTFLLLSSPLCRCDLCIARCLHYRIGASPVWAVARLLLSQRLNLGGRRTTAVGRIEMVRRQLEPFTSSHLLREILTCIDVSSNVLLVV